jgi:nucleotide-binding universal stress UspA family protein
MYKHIMVPLDGSKLAECVIPEVTRLVGQLKRTGEINLVRVVPPLHLYEGLEYSIPKEDRKRIEAGSIRLAEEYLSGIITKIKMPKNKIVAKVLTGSAAQELIGFVKSNKVDLVIISTHGRSGIPHWIIGSVAEKIIQSSVAPVLVIRPKECPPIS